MSIDGFLIDEILRIPADAYAPTQPCTLAQMETELKERAEKATLLQARQAAHEETGYRAQDMGMFYGQQPKQR